MVDIVIVADEDDDDEGLEEEQQQQRWRRVMGAVMGGGLWDKFDDLMGLDDRLNWVID